MKFTFEWLKDHLRTDLGYEEIAEKLTSLGIEVEEVIDNKKKFENFVVGFIESAEKHPNADKLQICRVNIGKETLQIVCGAKNARAGLYVAVALVGALIPAFNENLKKGTIRGIDSFGMMCSTDELLLEDDGIDGIMELPNNLTPGQDLASALNLDDVIFDVSLTPNRADCFSVRGIARDLAAIGAGDLLSLESFDIQENIENPVEVKIEAEGCEYFSTLALKNVSGKTPDYIVRRLKAIGQNLIHMPVDIANYILFDIGQPLHTFDLDRISKELVIRNSRQGELLKTLDNKDTILPDEAIVVSTQERPLSIAGIIGGEDSAISEDSMNVLLEAAYFDKVSIVKTGQKLRISTDSRTRFERGVDPCNTDVAIRYAATLISRASNGCQMSNVKKYGILPTNKHYIELTFSKFEAITGLTFKDFLNSKERLEKLGITVKSIDSEKMLLETPSWRHDLEIEEDIIEEILRLLGYENIQDVELPKENPITNIYVSDKVSDALIFNGYYEVKTFSFTDKKTAELFSSDRELLQVEDSLTSDFSTLRPSLIASHLKSIKNSQNKSQKNSRIFEIGRSFYKEDNSIVERNILTATISEKIVPANWRQKSENVSIFDVKGDIERILDMLGISFRLKTSAPSYYHPGRSGTYIFQKDIEIAYFGEIHPSITSDMGLTGPVVCFELFLDKLPEVLDYNPKKPLTLSQYQVVTRDFSFVVKRTIYASDILNTIKKLRISEIKDVSIFDVYESESIGSENKAVAFEVTLQSDKETLSEERIISISQKIIDSVCKNCLGILRDK